MFPSMDTPWTFCRRNQQNFRAQQLQRREVSLPPNAPLSKRRLSRRQSPLSPWGLSPPQLPPAPRALLLLPSPSPRLQLYPLLTLKSLSWANLWSPPRSGHGWSTQVTQAALHSRKEGEEERRAATRLGQQSQAKQRPRRASRICGSSAASNNSPSGMFCNMTAVPAHQEAHQLRHQDRSQTTCPLRPLWAHCKDT